MTAKSIDTGAGPSSRGTIRVGPIALHTKAQPTFNKPKRITKRALSPGYTCLGTTLGNGYCIVKVANCIGLYMEDV